MFRYFIAFILALALSPAQDRPRVYAEGTTNPVRRYPLNPVDRKIDELGSQIRTDSDALAYMEALLEKSEVKQADLAWLPQIKRRLARAEKVARADSSTPVPEIAVLETFNWMMEQFGAPASTRVTLAELRAFREFMAYVMYPRSSPRDPTGEVSEGCRPIEAIYLLYLLEMQRGVQPEIRAMVRSGQWPSRFSEFAAVNDAANKASELKPLPSDPAFWQRELEYQAARSQYFRAGAGSRLREMAHEILNRLGIP